MMSASSCRELMLFLFTDLWRVVSLCLLRLGKASDPHAVLALQPAAEAFFLVHAFCFGTSKAFAYLKNNICIAQFLFQDPAFYKSLEFLLNNPIDDLGLDLTFSLEYNIISVVKFFIYNTIL
uniref:Secreted protein n=1 Tax=Heterorhabditis bacteriophora TaxID=37862 RepID=A0A1I7WI83_HETBA